MCEVSNASIFANELILKKTYCSTIFFTHVLQYTRKTILSHCPNEQKSLFFSKGKNYG